MIVVDEFSDIDPSTLVTALLKEVTEDEVEYGHTLTQEPTERKLASGITLLGVKAKLSYREEESY